MTDFASAESFFHTPILQELRQKAGFPAAGKCFRRLVNARTS
jgi:hypothetical protein